MSNAIVPLSIPPPHRVETLPPDLSGGETPGGATEAVVKPFQMLPEVARYDPDLWLYRDRTVGLLRRYLRLSVQAGRLPSLLGREFFRTRVTSYRSVTFEDTVIFVHDVERCLEMLDEFDKRLLGKIVLQDYTQDETAVLLRCGLRTVNRRFPEVLDRVSESFLQSGLLARLPRAESRPVENSPETCQGGKGDEFFVSSCEQTQ